MAILDFFKRKQQTAQTSAIEKATGNRAGAIAWTDWGSEAATKEGYKASAWVYRSIAMRANAVASVPFVVESFKAGEWQREPNHPLQMLLDNPNPEMGQGELMRLLTTHLDLAGNGYWLKVRNAVGKAVELWPLLPHEVTAVMGTAELVQGYKLRGHTNLAREDVCHIAYTNPSSLIYGQSPLQAAAKAVDVDNAAAAWQKVSMQNRGIPDGVFSLDDDVTAEQFEQARQQVAEQYANQGNARAPWVVARAKWQQMSLTPAEMDFLNTRLSTREEIGVVFGTAEMLASLASANRASAQEVRKSFWIDTIIPLLEELRGALNIALVPEYGKSSTLRITYDTSGVAAIRADEKETLEIIKGLWSMGVPFNVLAQRYELGIEPIDGGDVGYLPTGVLPANFDFASQVSAGQIDAPSDSETIKAMAALAYGTKNR